MDILWALHIGKALCQRADTRVSKPLLWPPASLSTFMTDTWIMARDSYMCQVLSWSPILGIGAFQWPTLLSSWAQVRNHLQSSNEIICTEHRPLANIAPAQSPSLGDSLCYITGPCHLCSLYPLCHSVPHMPSQLLLLARDQIVGS